MRTISSHVYLHHNDSNGRNGSVSAGHNCKCQDVNNSFTRPFLLLKAEAQKQPNQIGKGKENSMKPEKVCDVVKESELSSKGMFPHYQRIYPR